MDKLILQQETPNDRLMILVDTCEKRIEFAYPKQLSDNERVAFKDTLVEKAIEIQKLELRLKEVKAEFAAELKPIKQEHNDILEIVKHGSQHVNEFVYLIADHDEKQMGYYNERGELVHWRPLEQNEFQLRITGTE